MTPITSVHSSGISGREQSRPCGGPFDGDAHLDAAFAALSNRAGPADPDLLARILRDHYGLEGEIEVLSSEVEQTAAVDLPGGERLILKTSSPNQPKGGLRFQAAALTRVERGPGFVAPHVRPTRSGAATFEQDGVFGYLQTRLSGPPLADLVMTPELLSGAGEALAQLATALGPLVLPDMRRPMLWHIGCWPSLIELRSHLPHGPVADAVDLAMSDYIDRIEQHLPDLAWQVTHNDPSPFNTFLTDAGVGFIDFGDGGFAPRIQDLAIAAGHFVADPARPLGGAEHLIEGYASVLPLSDLEARLLVGLMKARQSALILINHWRADLFPAEAAYIKKNVARAERGLAILAALEPGEAEAAVRGCARVQPRIVPAEL